MVNYLTMSSDDSHKNSQIIQKSNDDQTFGVFEAISFSQTYFCISFDVSSNIIMRIFLLQHM